MVIGRRARASARLYDFFRDASTTEIIADTPTRFVTSTSSRAIIYFIRFLLFFFSVRASRLFARISLRVSSAGHEIISRSAPMIYLVYPDTRSFAPRDRKRVGIETGRLINNRKSDGEKRRAKA